MTSFSYGQWLLSKLNSLVKFVDTNLENYKITETARALEDFTDELSNWYVRRSRERFWAKGMEQDKINAYMTLYTTLVTLAKISAPMVPFMTESIYRNLVCSIDKMRLFQYIYATSLRLMSSSLTRSLRRLWMMY